MKEWWRRVRPAVASKPIVWIARAINSTLRFRLIGGEHLTTLPGGKIVCGWHGRSFLAAVRFRKRGYWVIVSHSRDGEIQRGIFESQGFRIIRGSTGRGGARAAVESIRALRDSATMAITPDGPRGPTHVVQGGVMTMAQKSGAALIPAGAAASRCWHARSWDRYMIPAPFSRAAIVLGEPIFVAATANADEVEALRFRLEAAMNRAQNEAEAAVRAKQ